MHWASPIVPVKAQDGLHFLIAQHKIKDLKVILNPLRCNGLGDDNNIPLHLEADQDLGGSLFVLLCYGFDVWVIK